jgi:Xaa-Pro aminopeptidase
VIQDARDPPILKEGMVLAIEPYVVVGNEKYAVEDHVLVTKHGAEILSADLQSREMWWLIAG